MKSDHHKSTTLSKYKNPDNDPRGFYVLEDITAPFSPEARPYHVYEWSGHRPPPNRTWRYTKQRLNELDNQGVIVVSTKRRPRLKRYLVDTSEQSELPKKLSSLSKLELIVRGAMQSIVNLIAEYPNILDSVEWRDLERAMREVFESLGFDTELTRSGKDGGFDLRLTCIDCGLRKTFLVELKHWVSRSGKPGPTIFKAFYDIVASESEDARGLLLSTSGFTKTVRSGRSEIERQIVKLGNKNKIVSLCQNYLQTKRGLWRPTKSLPHVLFHDTI